PPDSRCDNPDAAGDTDHRPGTRCAQPARAPVQAPPTRVDGLSAHPASPAPQDSTPDIDPYRSPPPAVHRSSASAHPDAATDRHNPRCECGWSAPAQAALRHLRWRPPGATTV